MSTQRVPEFQFFEGKNGWYWRFRAANGEIMAVGAEPFSSGDACVMSISRLQHLVVDALVYQVSPETGTDNEKA